MKARKLTPLFLLILMVSVFTSCAAAGNIIEYKTLIGLLDLAVAGGITLFIFRGSNK